jgi:hypothetical protein
MLRTFTHTTVIAAIVAVLPTVAAAQSFYSPYGGSYRQRGTQCYGGSSYSSPYQYNSSYGNQYLTSGGCYGSSSSMPYGSQSSCNCGQGGCSCGHSHGLSGQGGCNCGQCQGHTGGQACAMHGIVNCPQCQGLNSHTPLQYNLYGGTNCQQSLPSQSNSPYFQNSPGYYNLGTYQTTPTWYSPTSSGSFY